MLTHKSTVSRSRLILNTRKCWLNDRLNIIWQTSRPSLQRVWHQEFDQYRKLQFTCDFWLQFLKQREILPRPFDFEDVSVLGIQVGLATNRCHVLGMTLREAVARCGFPTWCVGNRNGRHQWPIHLLCQLHRLHWPFEHTPALLLSTSAVWVDFLLSILRTGYCFSGFSGFFFPVLWHRLHNRNGKWRRLRSLIGWQRRSCQRRVWPLPAIDGASCFDRVKPLNLWLVTSVEFVGGLQRRAKCARKPAGSNSSVSGLTNRRRHFDAIFFCSHRFDYR